MPDPSGTRQITVREYDGLIRNWGPPAVTLMAPDADFSESVLRTILSAFRPVARVLGASETKLGSACVANH